MCDRPRARTARRRNGDRAEDRAVDYLRGLGWEVIAQNVRIGRDEVDILATDPSAPALVFVEVRSSTTGRFGAPEERIDARKITALFRAASALIADAELVAGRRLPRLPWRVDLVAVDDYPVIGPGAGGMRIRHARGVTPS